MRFFLLLLLFPFFVSADTDKLLENIMGGGVTVDLREPTYCDGVLTTEKGGVICTPDIRIQARKISYMRKSGTSNSISYIIAEDDLILEFNGYVFVGNRLEYDFERHSGTLYEGRTAIEPWFFGGDIIHLLPDGSYRIQNALITTSEDVNPEWGVEAKSATLTKNSQAFAKNVRFRISNTSLLWLPFFRINLNSIFDSPIRYEVRAGSQGPRVSVAYEIFSWNRFRTFARVDYRLERGWGGGIETEYLSEDHSESLETVNFIARDAKSNSPHNVRIRYRFQGAYVNEVKDKNVTIEAYWDKLSDKEMATDYRERGLDIEEAGRTQLLIRKQTDWWITNLTTRVRINNFQTLKQELPSIETNIIPFEIGSTGILSQNQVSASFLDFKYANSVPEAHDYQSTRLHVSERLYRPFVTGPFTTTPEIGGLMIFEGNSPRNHPSWVGLGLMAVQTETRIYKFYDCCKHVLRPYTRYEYYTSPTTSPNDHYIFDIDDGWYRLNMVRFGFANNFYFKDHFGLMNRYFEADLFSFAFFNSSTIPETIPKLYGRLSWNSLSTLRHRIDTAWDFEERQLDHFNFRTDWTIARNAAIAAEYRHRSAYSWRKADPYNFFLDAYRSVDRLRHSQLSDRRDTILLHAYYRFLPTWAIEVESRHGFGRRREPNYNEYEVTLFTTLRSAWNIKVSYQHLEDDDRFTFAISLGMNRPSTQVDDSLIPKIEF